MVNVMSLCKTKLPEETDLEYCNRICSIKEELDMTWKEIATVANHELGVQHSYSWYSRNYRAGNFSPELGIVTTSSEDCDEFCETCEELPNCLKDWKNDLAEKQSDIQNKMRNLAMKKVEVSDLVTQNNAYIRRLSREQTIKDIAHDYAQTMAKSKLLTAPVPDNVYVTDFSESEGVLLLSDWHYGMVCDNPWNKFDPEICKERVSTLLNKVIKIVRKNNIAKVHVLDLADLIAGRIHTQIRIESRFDVITQTMEVSEILAEFLNELSHYCDVEFYSCLDNHSRLEPNKKESMDLESLARLIPWYLLERLKCNDAITIHDNTYGADIITCIVAGHNVIGVHGDNDHPTTALGRLSLMTHRHYDLLCTAHRHHMQLEEDHQSIVISNGCLMGVDRYAEKLRLTSDPSQTFIIATPDNACEAIYRIVLK